jgi:hypothetical protein
MKKVKHNHLTLLKINMKFFLIVAILILGIQCTSKEDAEYLKSSSEFYMPDDGFVPDDVTAIKIAEAIWLPIYGQKIYTKMPFIATLKNDSIWVVEGTKLNFGKGGVPYIEIQKNDCRILFVTHGK